MTRPFSAAYPILEYDEAAEAVIEPRHVIRRENMPGHAFAYFFQDTISLLVEEREDIFALSRVTLVRQCQRPNALSAVEHRPANVVSQPLVVEHELANRLRELVALPPALASPRTLALAFRRGSTRGLDRIGSRTKLVRGDVRDDRGLAGSVRGVPRCPTQVSGRAHCMAARRASLGHLDLATRPGTRLLDRLTRSRVLRLNRLKEVKDVLRAGCRPQGEEMMIRIGEGPATADRHETRVAIFW